MHHIWYDMEYEPRMYGVVLSVLLHLYMLVWFNLFVCLRLIIWMLLHIIVPKV